MIQQPSRDIPISRTDGIAQDQFQGWIDSVTELLNSLEVLEGSGSPEGVVFASAKRFYFNTSGAPGTFLYFKTTAITLNTGWIAAA